MRVLGLLYGILGKISGCSMKKQVVYIHGGEAYSNYEDFLYDLEHEDIGDPLKEASPRWKNRLRTDLPEYEVFMPMMPNKQNAKYLEWKIVAN